MRQNHYDVPTKMKSLLNMFKRKEEKYPFLVVAKLVEQLVPDERSRLYADPLSAYLEERGLGTVSGGGSLLADRAQPGEKDIESATLDIELANLDEALAIAKRKLTDLGAPVWSEIEYTAADGTNHAVPIGELELLNIFIDNMSLPREIYDNADTEAISIGLSRALGTELHR